MYIAIQNNTKTSINNYTDGTVTCPVCGSSLIAKRGDLNAHHFAHKVKNDCDSLYKPMSDWHKEWQDKFKPEYQEVIVEAEGKKHIADIKIGNLVIEFQHSPISLKDIESRNSTHKALGNKVVWLFDYRHKHYNFKVETKRMAEWKYKNRAITELLSRQNNAYHPLTYILHPFDKEAYLDDIIFTQPNPDVSYYVQVSNKVLLRLDFMVLIPRSIILQNTVRFLYERNTKEDFMDEFGTYKTGHIQLPKDDLRKYLQIFHSKTSK